MKDLHELGAVGVRLEEAARRMLPAGGPDPPSVYDAYEAAAIAILDAEAYEFECGVLQRFLEAYLEGVRRRLGLPPLQ